MLLNRLAVCISIVFLLSPVLSNTSQPADSSENHPKWSFLFQISSSFRLTNFDNATFGGAYYFSEGKALRLVTRFELRNSDQKTEEFGGRTITENRRSIFLNPSYIGFLKQRKKVSPYFGIGPTWEFVYGYLRDGADEPRTSVIAQDEVKQYELGISLISGVEYALLEQITIHAEYGVIASYIRNEFFDARTGSSESNIYSIESQPVRFGITIFW